MGASCVWPFDDAAMTGLRPKRLPVAAILVDWINCLLRIAFRERQHSRQQNTVGQVFKQLQTDLDDLPVNNVLHRSP